MSAPLAIGIDLGGTNLKVAAVDTRGRILTKLAESLDDTKVEKSNPGRFASRAGSQNVEKRPEPRALARAIAPSNRALDPQTTIDEMVRLSDEVLASLGATRRGVAGVGVGSPGPLSQSRGVVVRCANLPGWENVPLRDTLSGRLGLPVILENDANAAAFGEFWSGKMSDGDESDMVLLTLGTGVGAGAIVNGRILHGHFENAAELGHWIMVPGGLACPCGQHGCLEQYASASGVARRVVAAIEAGQPSRLAEKVRLSQPIDSEIVVQYAKAGDELCQRVWQEACAYLAVACINIQHAYNPARIVLGGGMAEAGAFLLDGVAAEFRRLQWRLHNDFPQITLARLGYDAGVLGAAALVWHMVQ